MLERLHLESPWFLLLVPVVLAVAVIGWRRRLPALMVSSLVPYRRSLGGKQPKGPAVMLRIPLLLETLALLALTVALARPQLGIEETVARAEGIDIMLALDISGSMEAVDTSVQGMSERAAIAKLEASKNRLEVAREQVAAFVDSRPNDRIGLVAFAGKAYTVSPPTLDHDFLKSGLFRLEPGLLQDRNTNIAAPIATGTSRLKDSEAKRRVMVLFTDGANTVDDKISPEQAARLATRFEVIIHTVGIGGASTYAPIRGTFGVSWQPQRQSFDEALLQTIASETEGQYFTAGDEDAFAEVMARIDELETTTVEQTVYVDYRELFPAWLAGGLILLLLAVLLEHTLLVKVP